MKKTKTKLFVLFLLWLPSILYSQDSTYLLKMDRDTKEATIGVTSYPSDKLSKVCLNDKIKVTISVDSINIDSVFRGIDFYLNNVLVGKLTAMQQHEYYIVIPEVTSNKDTLAQLFNPDFKESVDLEMSLKFDENNKFRLKGEKLTIVFDKNRSLKSWWIIIISLSLFILLIYVLLSTNFQILRDQSNLGKGAPFSLARTQLAFWTLLVTIAFLLVWYKTGKPVTLTYQVLILMGISVGTKSIAKSIDNKDIQDTQKSRHQNENKSKDFILNILSDANGLSVSRLQNLFFTVLIGSYFLFEVWINNKIPALDPSLLLLMGISSSAYLYIKKSENSTAKDNIVG